MSTIDTDVLMARLSAHPEVELPTTNEPTRKLVELVPVLLTTELSRPLSVGTLMCAQHTFLSRFLEHGSPDDQSWYSNALARVRGWRNPVRFLEMTQRTVGFYLDWSFVPRDHRLRTTSEANDQTVRDLFLIQPATILAPMLRGVRNTRH
jgi:hypothetical protein